MPIIKKINDNSSEIFIWEIDEEKNTLFHLTDDRLKKGFEKIVKEEPKLQWLASRALLSAIIKEKDIQFDSIKKDEFGKPYLTNCEWNFSISHSGKYAALIISKNNFIGVDIETKFEQTHRLKNKFSTDFELNFIGNDFQKSALIWSAKESIYKAYGKKRLIFKDDMRMINSDNNSLDFSFSKSNSDINVTFIIEGGYLISWTNTER